MKHREKILAAIFGIFIAYFGGTYLWQHLIVEGPLATKRAKLAKGQDTIDDYNMALITAIKAGKKLDSYRQRSLPLDVERAQSLYQNWLLGLVENSGFNGPSVRPGAVANRTKYRSLAFSVNGRASLEQLTQFLYEFYRANHLHQIQSLTVTPTTSQQGVAQFSLTISIEALVIAKAVAKDDLQDEQTDERLAFKNLDDYAFIAERNIFAIGGGSVDIVEHTVLTGVIGVDDELEAWFTLGTTGQITKLRVGEGFRFGAVNGRIAEIHGEDVILDSDGERWLIARGESVANASLLPAEY